jgi:hypothetical protein
VRGGAGLVVVTGFLFALPVAMASVGCVVGAAVSVMVGSSCADAAPNLAEAVRGESSAAFDAETRSIAVTAIRVADLRRLPERAKVVILAAGLQESGSGDPERPMIRNLGHGDRDSVGWLQQRRGWGSVADRMNPGMAAGKFYDALVKVPHWTELPVTVAAQRVQISGFPGAYARWQGAAERLIVDVADQSPTGAPTAVDTSGCSDGGSLDGSITLVAELNPPGAGNWHGAVRAAPYWYVAHATAGDRRQVFHRLDRSGRELDQMSAVGFAHTTSFGVISNTVYATDGQNRIVTFPYRAGATIHSGSPTGWRGSISVDPNGRTALIRNGNKYQAYDLRTKLPYGQMIVTDPRPRQGFSVNGGAVYVLTGPTNQPGRLDSYSVSSGQATGTRDITPIGFKVGERHDHREPEGMHGNLMGIKVGTGDRRRLRIYQVNQSPGPTTTSTRSAR